MNNTGLEGVEKFSLSFVNRISGSLNISFVSLPELVVFEIQIRRKEKICMRHMHFIRYFTSSYHIGFQIELDIHNPVMAVVFTFYKKSHVWKKKITSRAC